MDLICGCRYSRQGLKLIRSCRQHKPFGAKADDLSTLSPALRAQRTTHNAQDTTHNAQRTAQTRSALSRDISTSKIRRDGLSPAGYIIEDGWTEAGNATRPKWDAAQYADIRDHGTGLQGYKPTYRHHIGDSPVVSPWDSPEEKIRIARRFLDRIDTAQEELRGRLTFTESKNLRVLERKWAKRAYRQDARYMAFGTRGGGIGEDDRPRLKMWQRIID